MKICAGEATAAVEKPVPLPCLNHKEPLPDDCGEDFRLAFASSGVKSSRHTEVLLCMARRKDPGEAEEMYILAGEDLRCLRTRNKIHSAAIRRLLQG